MATIVPQIRIHREWSEQADVHNAASYLQTVNEYAKITHEQSLYPGQNFEALAQFLRSPSNTVTQHQYRHTRTEKSGWKKTPIVSPASASTSAPSCPQSYATHYSLVGEERAQARHLTRPEELQAVAEACSQQQDKKTGQLLILRGYPSPAWLCTVGALYDVDPEFFRRHLDFLASSSADDGGDVGSIGGSGSRDGATKLPSSTTNMFQFRLPTVGSYVGPTRRRRGARADSSLRGLQDTAQAAMARYLHLLRVGARWRTGDSIVRQYNVHSEDRWSIEQAVTVFFSRLRQPSDSWIVIVFLDSGSDPSLSTWPVDEYSSASPVPFPHHKRSLALKPDLWTEEPNGSDARKFNSNNNLNANNVDSQFRSAYGGSRLHLRYGRFLRPDVMRQDPFYALAEFFSVLAYSETQILDLLESSLVRDSWLAVQVGGYDAGGDDESSSSEDKAAAAQENLIRIRQMLEARIENIGNVLDIVDRHQRGAEGLGYHSSWPHCGDHPQQQRESLASARALSLDFAHLQRRATELYARCKSAMTMAMNRASISEARRSIQQARVVSRFTALAFVFVPASATASFFGMNFREMGTGSLSIWVFFAIAVPIFGISFMFLYDGWRKSWTLISKVAGTSSVKKFNDQGMNPR